MSDETVWSLLLTGCRFPIIFIVELFQKYNKRENYTQIVSHNSKLIINLHFVQQVSASTTAINKYQYLQATCGKVLLNEQRVENTVRSHLTDNIKTKIWMLFYLIKLAAQTDKCRTKWCLFIGTGLWKKNCVLFPFVVWIQNTVYKTTSRW